MLNHRLLSRTRHITRSLGLHTRRTNSNTTASDYQSRYLDKLRQRAEENGLSVSQLLEKAKEEEAERRKTEAAKLKEEAAKFAKHTPLAASSSTPLNRDSDASKADQTKKERKDAPPYRPLSSILDLNRISSTPHTAEQISALWTAYHASRTGGTGRGYVCASIPLPMFQKLSTTGRAYPTFVLALPRIQPPEPGATSKEDNVAHEFYFMQWDFHASPEVPSADLFAKPDPSAPSNPPSATVIFTPLQEYKLRQAFSTPYLVLTLYTDLAASHGLVLLRGEITPTSTSGTGQERFMLSQEDAQLLAISLQKFYLWNDRSGTEDESKAERLVRTFHEKPEEFKWEELLEMSKSLI
ncbi:ATP11-domain-containing protein [Agrocybe pediades]|nr:ATP11-domain-containing protein [Agrocybe pediades]